MATISFQQSPHDIPGKSGYICLMCERLIKWMTLPGWKGRISLLLAGAVTALTLAPFYLWPLLIPGYSLLFMQWFHAPSSRAAFWCGWWWGFGFFLAGLYWIVIALTIDLARFGWMIPFALFGISGALALFTAAGGWVFSRIKHASLPVNLLLFTLILFVTEWLRGHILTGFPWNLIGYSWGASHESAQAASLIGVYGLTLITPFLAASAVCFLWRRWMLTPVLSLCVVIGLCLYGGIRLNNAVMEDSGTVVRIVQGNIAQSLKWNPAHMREAMDHYAQLTQTPAERTPDIVVWPETAIPYTIRPESDVPKQLGELLSEGQVLITGAVLAAGSRELPHLTNSLLAIRPDGTMTQYDKRHLVPFGEYVPLRQWLPVEKVTPGTVDFTAGTGDNLLELGGVLPPVRALICYEVIFPSYSAGGKTGWLVNITNDAWYKNSSGPYQHLEMSRFRAIEQGVAMVRAANTGVSAAYDPYGREIGTISLGKRGFIDISLPKPLTEPTVYGSIFPENTTNN